MEKSVRKLGQTLFDSIRHVDEDGNEYWLARELYDMLGYSSWENFEKLIAKAKMSVSQSGMPVENHFHDVKKMVELGSGSKRSVSDVELTRHACYVIAQNGSAAKKPAVAAAQAYFAIQTRKQEVSEQLNYDIQRLNARQKYTESDKQMSEAIMEKGVGARGLADIKSSGDKKMYGGKTTRQMKQQYGITNRRTPLANRTPNVVLAAKTLANEITAQNLADYPIDGYQSIKAENDGNNTEVRKTLLIRGIVPEHLPPAEDTDEIMNRLKSKDKRKALEDE